MICERWIDLILGEEDKFTLEERIFNSILFVSALAAGFLFIADIIQKMKPNIFLFSLAAFAILSGLFFLSRRLHITRALALPYGILLTVVVIYVWYTNGGVEGIAFFYFLPLIFIVPLFARDYFRFIFLVSIILIGLVLLLIEIKNPDIVFIIENSNVRKIDKYVSAILVSITILLGLILILHSYNKQHQKVIDLVQSKDKINSIIAHDLKNPIGTLNGLSKFLLERFDETPSDRREQMLAAIVKSSEETYNLLENLLQWARSESGMFKINKEKLNTSVLVMDAVRFMSESIYEKKLNLKIEIEEDIFVYADQNMLDTVFRNLLSNAIKFTPSAGEIDISIQKTDNQKVSILFKDSGIGIEQGAIKKLFNKDLIYTTTGTNKEKGTGLGLKLCNEFVLKNKGTIHVQSELGKGTVFEILFPVVKNFS